MFQIVAGCFVFQVLAHATGMVDLEGDWGKAWRLEFAEHFTCCTPSPPTSLKLCTPGTQPILSTSSKNTIPEKATQREVRIIFYGADRAFQYFTECL